jgi:hypothetical protein
LRGYLAQVTRSKKTDPGHGPMREDPRFQAMTAETETRLAAEEAVATA